MKKAQRRIYPAIVLAFACVVFSAHKALATSQSEHYGQRTFEDRCATCHGPGGKGDGPMAQVLKSPPSDLTVLARKAKGQFPFGRIYKTIDGRFAPEIPSHGTRVMPVWGNAFRAEVLEADLPGVYAEEVVQGRILGLIYYIQSLQVE